MSPQDPSRSKAMPSVAPSPARSENRSSREPAPGGTCEGPARGGVCEGSSRRSASEPPLLVALDDDLLQIRILEKILAESGARCLFFRDAREALEEVARQRPDVVLTDWMMPGVDGLEVVRRIKSDPALRSTWVVLVSARGSLDDRVQGLEVGADDYLSKPFEGRELVARVRNGLRIRSLERDLREVERDAALLTAACTMGHQINNPLLGILGTLQLIEEQQEEGRPIDLERHLEVLRLSAEHIRTTVERLCRLRTTSTLDYVDKLKMLDLGLG